MWEQQSFASSEFFRIVDPALQPCQYGCSVEPLRELINTNPTLTENPVDLINVLGWLEATSSGHEQRSAENFNLCDRREIGSPSSSSESEHQFHNFDPELYPTIDDCGLDVFGVISDLEDILLSSNNNNNNNNKNSNNNDNDDDENDNNYEVFEPSTTDNYCRPILAQVTNEDAHNNDNNVHHVTHTTSNRSPGSRVRRSSVLLHLPGYKHTDEYRMHREKNNESVKRCREEKRRQRQKVETELEKLRADNKLLLQVIQNLLAEKYLRDQGSVSGNATYATVI